MTKLPLTEWDRSIANHLHMIRAGAEMCVRNVERMMTRPEFETLAEADLERAEQTLTSALQKIHYAQALFREKPADA